MLIQRLNPNQTWFNYKNMKKSTDILNMVFPGHLDDAMKMRFVYYWKAEYGWTTNEYSSLY